MSKYSLVFVLLCISLTSVSQSTADYGIFGGISSYIGDINPSKMFYSPRPATGIFYRYNLHSRQSIKGSLSYGSFYAADADFDVDYQQNRDASFEGQIAEIAAQYEFNFFSYSTMGKRWDYTPYLAGGIGASLFSSNETVIRPIIPLSIGFKVNIHKNLGLEAEYGVRKTFYDNFDGLKDNIAESDYAILHNNDWYFFAGVAMTWKIYNRFANCPAYNDVDKKRKK